MLIFYEGRPGSGKSLCAIKEYVVPMLAKQRTVFAYVEGLNHKQIAELAGIELEKCHELLKVLTREQVPHFYKFIQNDAFVVIDEVQNFFPKGRKPLEQETANFFAEYRHLGLDILLMGQVFADVHTFILNRCSDRVLFTKRDAVGKANEFTQTIYKPIIKGDKTAWQEIRKIKALPYDSTYFGAYKSHTDDTDNKDTLTDERANVWNSPILKKWLPLYGLVFVFALGYIIYMFAGGGLEKSIAPQQAKKIQPPKSMTLAELQSSQIKKDPVTQPVQKVNDPVQVTEPTPQLDDSDPIVELNKQGRLRLSAYFKMGKKIDGLLEWRGNDYSVIERITFTQLKAMGYVALVDADGTIAIITNGLHRFIATSYPVQDPLGSITQNRESLIQSNTVTGVM